jgi:hypothetical protein
MIEAWRGFCTPCLELCLGLGLNVSKSVPQLRPRGLLDARIERSLRDAW